MRGENPLDGLRSRPTGRPLLRLRRSHSHYALKRCSNRSIRRLVTEK
ncbi:MAG: hypothetical protein ACOVSW_19345 [Candidatus Kapaibacteriota bacterium]